MLDVFPTARLSLPPFGGTSPSLRTHLGLSEDSADSGVVAAVALVAVGEEAGGGQVVAHEAEHLADLQGILSVWYM